MKSRLDENLMRLFTDQKLFVTNIKNGKFLPRRKLKLVLPFLIFPNFLKNKTYINPNFQNQK